MNLEGIMLSEGLPLWLSESAYNSGTTGDMDLIPELRRFPGGGHVNSLQYYCLENPHEQRSLVGYSPWDCKELDMTE